MPLFSLNMHSNQVMCDLSLDSSYAKLVSHSKICILLTTKLQVYSHKSIKVGTVKNITLSLQTTWRKF